MNRCLGKKFMIDLSNIEKKEYDEIMSMIGSAVHTIAKKVVTFKLCFSCFELIWNHFKSLIDIYKGNSNNLKGEKKKRGTMFRSFSLENRFSMIDAELLEDLANNTESYDITGGANMLQRKSIDIPHRFVSNQRHTKDNTNDPLNLLLQEMKETFSDSVIKSIEEEFIPVLMDINLSDSIDSGLSLSNYIKIYDQTTTDED